MTRLQGKGNAEPFWGPGIESLGTGADNTNEKTDMHSGALENSDPADGKSIRDRKMGPHNQLMNNTK